VAELLGSLLLELADAEQCLLDVGHQLRHQLYIA
jgi:hypothetical protein